MSLEHRQRLWDVANDPSNSIEVREQAFRALQILPKPVDEMSKVEMLEFDNDSTWAGIEQRRLHMSPEELQRDTARWERLFEAVRRTQREAEEARQKAPVKIIHTGGPINGPTFRTTAARKEPSAIEKTESEKYVERLLAEMTANNQMRW